MFETPLFETPKKYCEMSQYKGSLLKNQKARASERFFGSRSECGNHPPWLYVLEHEISNILKYLIYVYNKL